MAGDNDHDKLIRLESSVGSLPCGDHERRLRVVETKTQRNSLITGVVTVVLQLAIGAIIVAIVSRLANGH